MNNDDFCTRLLVLVLVVVACFVIGGLAAYFGG